MKKMDPLLKENEQRIHYKNHRLGIKERMMWILLRKVPPLCVKHFRSMDPAEVRWYVFKLLDLLSAD